MACCCRELVRRELGVAAGKLNSGWCFASLVRVSNSAEPGGTSSKSSEMFFAYTSLPRIRVMKLGSLKRPLRISGSGSEFFLSGVAGEA